MPSWYLCSCGGNGAAPGCVCPSTAPPGGLPPAATPQFVLFTHDDAITSEAFGAFREILGGLQSARGCKAAATLFTLSRGTGERAPAWLRLVAAPPQTLLSSNP